MLGGKKKYGSFYHRGRFTVFILKIFLKEGTPLSTYPSTRLTLIFKHSLVAADASVASV